MIAAGQSAAFQGSAIEQSVALATGIVEAPIPWTSEREQLTVAYRRAHHDSALTSSAIAPTMIVEHYTAGSSAMATIRYFSRPRIESSRAKLLAGGAVNVSAHFVIERDGTIYRLLPATKMARHCIGLNHVAIGIENVGDEQKYPLTDVQVAANARLIRYLAGRYPITHLIGHYESPLFVASPLWLELDPGYRNAKPDPGARFMTLLRAEVADLGLRAEP